MKDLISNLPDPILFHILSCLPFPSAIQTLFLSKRWRLLWQTALVQHGTTTEDVSGAVSGFLNHFNERDPSRNTRKLQFHFGSAAVLSATIGPNNKLYLNFSDGKQEFPRQFGLQLEFNHQNIIANQPSLSGIHSFPVKDLHLTSVTHLTNEAVSSVVSDFQFLETLKITGCNGLQNLSIGSHTGLKNLTILDCSQLESLQLETSKLRIFRYRGTLPWIRPEIHYNLADAMLDCREGPSNNSFTLSDSDFDYVLLTIKNATALTLCKWTFKALISPSLSTFLAEFQFYNLKELWWIDNLDERYDSEVLVSFLKLCPSLEQLFVTVSSN
uniref:F-box family protein n=1 Tax=Rhizophora mucronata TaxID=61149 RepID=A0A2P2K3R9_RHIMU